MRPLKYGICLICVAGGASDRLHPRHDPGIFCHPDQQLRFLPAVALGACSRLLTPYQRRRRIQGDPPKKPLVRQSCCH
jgi:hypothetical protein